MPLKNETSSANGLFDVFAAAIEYMGDTAQRSVLFMDVMRQRGNQYHAHRAEKAPNVLSYSAELVMDGRTLARPVNYMLARIVPPQGTKVDEGSRPFVIVDPRAGHGPGIGGFKADSEVGFALKAGHICYFIGFLPEPVEGQTIEDVARAEAAFLEKVQALHPVETHGKPCVIGNCQAGWAVMALAAIRPELCGPIIIAGAPLSYWAGVRGKSPMRYNGGLLGGSWITAFLSDIGGGTFDGAWLVQNFEAMNPSNTYWTKQYNVYANVDTEPQRYLEFERWWDGHINLNAAEIQFIVDELFIANHLSPGLIKTADGEAIDLRNIRSPIVVFCSEGDDITPPQQALGWILDLYEDADDIVAYGQTIVYSVHKTVGHLGIFVSGGVARKEHSEFSSNIDLIDILPPGLYEATFEPKSGDTKNSDLVSGEWVMRCEQRSLDDIQRIVGTNVEDDRRFATAARISERNLAYYRRFIQPMVRASVSPLAAEWIRKYHPLRVQYEWFSDTNPWTRPLAELAQTVSKRRHPASATNPFLAMQEAASRQMVGMLDAYHDVRDTLYEQLFLAIYGLPALQAAVGIEPTSASTSHKAGKSPLYRQLVQARIAELKARIDQGGLMEATLRGLIYVGLARSRVDERGIEALRRLHRAKGRQKLTLQQFKASVREQFCILLIDTEAALAAIPSLLPADAVECQQAFAAIGEVLNASGDLDGEGAARLARVGRLFGIEESALTRSNILHHPHTKKAG